MVIPEASIIFGKSENSCKPNDFKVGDLVSVISESHGIKEKCLWPENFDKAINPWDNVKIRNTDIGMVVGFLVGWHTCMVIVCWGGDLGGQKLAISEIKLKKATFLEK